MFAENLKYFRKRAGYTQQELADKIGVSRSTIGMYESSNREPDFITVEMFADVFNVNISTLLGEKEKAPALSSKDFIKEILDNSSNAELIDIIQMATERLKGN